MYDALFTYGQFIGPLPSTYKEFAKKWTRAFPVIYDTKVLAKHIMNKAQSAKETIFTKTQLQHVFEKCDVYSQEKFGRDLKKKKICNNLSFSFDDKKNRHFGSYNVEEGHAHDAGFDAYMTGLSFAVTAKYIEIGQLIKPISNQK